MEGACHNICMLLTAPKQAWYQAEAQELWRTWQTRRKHYAAIICESAYRQRP